MMWKIVLLFLWAAAGDALRVGVPLRSPVASTRSTDGRGGGVGEGSGDRAVPGTGVLESAEKELDMWKRFSWDHKAEILGTKEEDGWAVPCS